MSTTPLSTSAQLSNSVWTTVITVDSPLASAVVNIRYLLNNLDIPSKLRAAIVPISFDNNSGVPAASQYVQPVDIILGPAGVEAGIIEDTGVVILAGYKLVAKVDTGIVACRAHGFGRNQGA